MRIAIYTDLEWALGVIHRDLAAELIRLGHSVVLCDWLSVEACSHVEADAYMTLPGIPAQSLKRVGIPPEKTWLVAHLESDFISFSRSVGLQGFGAYAGYGVVSDNLACSSLAVGIQRVPEVLRLGIDVERYRRDPPEALNVVGYTTVMERFTEYGHEHKRGELARRCAEAAGCRFYHPSIQGETAYSHAGEPKVRVKIERVHELYGVMDAYVLPSLVEGAGYPALEAAAAGRLVIAAPVGHCPRLANEGLLTLAPLGEKKFFEFTVAALRICQRESAAFLEACKLAQEQAVKHRSWSVVAPDWVSFLSSPAT
jgi:glycosyltransferase involved in cell wall biosynthesis